jgi:hypothetical protein
MKQIGLKMITHADLKQHQTGFQMSVQPKIKGTPSSSNPIDKAAKLKAEVNLWKYIIENLTPKLGQATPKYTFKHVLLDEDIKVERYSLKTSLKPNIIIEIA